jgi:hypothetical protein
LARYSGSISTCKSSSGFPKATNGKDMAGWDIGIRKIGDYSVCGTSLT